MIDYRIGVTYNMRVIYQKSSYLLVTDLEANAVFYISTLTNCTLTRGAPAVK
jgi:hypothetical protein